MATCTLRITFCSSWFYFLLGTSYCDVRLGGFFYVLEDDTVQLYFMFRGHRSAGALDYAFVLNCVCNNS